MELAFLRVYFAMQGRVWNYRKTRSVHVTMLCHCISLKFLIFPFLKSQKCLKTMFKTFILHPESCAYLMYTKAVTYNFTQHSFHKLYIYLNFFIFLPFHGNLGFQAYLPAKHYFTIFCNMWMSIHMKIRLKTIFLAASVQNNFQTSLFVCNER